jgi:hypothetical protein
MHTRLFLHINPFAFVVIRFVSVKCLFFFIKFKTVSVFIHHSNISVTVLIVPKSNGNIIFACTFSLNVANHISAPVDNKESIRH